MEANGFLPMNLEELEADLPNGLHDALLRTFSSDAAEQRAEFILDIWIGDLHSPLMSERERRSPARLEFLGLTYLVIDAANPQHGLIECSPVQLDTCGADGDLERSRQVPPGGFAGRFFVTEWNSFIHFAALEARLTWIGVN
jgi:hypothetical protein